MTSSFKKATALLNRLEEDGVLIHAAQRIELKRVKSGHFRVWFGTPGGVKMETAANIHRIAGELGMTANPFAKAGTITAVTFVDDDESDDRA